jgi:hypothetical protein
LAIQLEHELSTAAPRWQRTYPPEWEKWAELPADTIPEKLRERATTAQIEALPDLLRAVFRDGAPSAAARFGDQPPPALPVSDEERMTLEAEERAIIAAGEALAAPL